MQKMIIGVDCATIDSKVGLALGFLGGESLKILHVTTGRSQAVVKTIESWIPESVSVLLALDAPLGWPADLGELLRLHRAGEYLVKEPNEMFRRLTDRVVREKTGKPPLDVGADRIARTAHTALTLLEKLRGITGRPIPLAWEPNSRHEISAIEVYPAATLTVYELQSSAYKKREQDHIRKRMVEQLSSHLLLPKDCSLLETNSDALDAVGCVLAAADFLSGCCIQPDDPSIARKEGWIWVREPDTSVESGNISDSTHDALP